MKHRASKGGNGLKFALLSLIITVILCAVFAAIISSFKISGGAARIVVFLIMIVSVLPVAFLFAKSRGRKGLLNGFFMATAYFIALILLSVALKGKLHSATDTALRFIVIAAAGMLGGILGVNL